MSTAAHFAHCTPTAVRITDAMLAGYELNTCKYELNCTRPVPQRSRHDQLPELHNGTTSRLSVAPSTKALPPRLVIKSSRMAPCRAGLVEFARNNLQEPQRGSGAYKISITLRYFRYTLESPENPKLVEQWNFCDLILEPSTSYDKLFTFLQRKVLNALKKYLKERVESEPSDVSATLKLVCLDEESMVTANGWHSYIRNNIRFGNCEGQLQFDFMLSSEQPTSTVAKLKTAATAASSAVSRFLFRDRESHNVDENKSEDFEQRYTSFRTQRQKNLICRRRAREHLVV